MIAPIKAVVTATLFNAFAIEGVGELEVNVGVAGTEVVDCMEVTSGMEVRDFIEVVDDMDVSDGRDIVGTFVDLAAMEVVSGIEFVSGKTVEAVVAAVVVVVFVVVVDGVVVDGVSGGGGGGTMSEHFLISNLLTRREPRCLTNLRPEKKVYIYQLCQANLKNKKALKISLKNRQVERNSIASCSLICLETTRKFNERIQIQNDTKELISFSRLWYQYRIFINFLKILNFW